MGTLAAREPSLEGLEITGEVTSDFAEILTPEALKFVMKLHRQFNDRRLVLLQKRVERQAEIDGGNMPDFLSDFKHIKEGDWQVAPIPDDLQDRRVEITGPAERKMIINALNSGANVFMADFEDANSPTWYNMVQGQVNLRDAVAGTISLSTPKKEYRLNDEIATLLVRPRGWHLDEKHVLLDGKPISGALFDFGLFFFHNAKKQIDNGTGHTSMLPNWKIIWSLGFGTMCSVWLRMKLGFLAALLGALSCWRPFSLPLKWRRFCMR